jgi:hypothetical protein
MTKTIFAMMNSNQILLDMISPSAQKPSFTSLVNESDSNLHQFYVSQDIYRMFHPPKFKMKTFTKKRKRLQQTNQKKSRLTYVRKSPQLTTWWHDYVLDLDENHRNGKRFRARYRVPFDFVILIYQWVQSWYVRKRTDAARRPSAPIELMVLSCLRILGRGWTFDCCAEATNIGRDTIRTFFHEFVLRFVSLLTTLPHSLVTSAYLICTTSRFDHVPQKTIGCCVGCCVFLGDFW